MQRIMEILSSDLFGKEAVITDLSGIEEISRTFEFDITIDSPEKSIDPSKAIGQAFGVRIDRGDEEPRYIHGYINRLWAGDFVEVSGSNPTPSRIYRIKIVPWTWFMNRASRSFVYLPEKEKKSIQNVIDEVISRVKSYGHVNTWNDTSVATILKNRMVEHCVQYRETDFNFLSRTLERYGIFYYFKHEEDKHTLIMCDKNVYPVCVESEVELHSSTATHVTTDRITRWEHGYEFVSGKVEQTDYDFKNPSTSLKVNATRGSNVSLNSNAGYELYDFSNDYEVKDDGQEEASRRMEEEELRYNSVVGHSSCKTFTPGYVFQLKTHHASPEDAGKMYLITSVQHSASQPGRFTSTDTPAEYANRFTCVPKEVQYRPIRITSKPQISSIQTAMVVGPAGEEIYTDKYGRVKVQFHWDREGKRDENTSCWIRVSQSHAGGGFGGILIPRIGEEVIVSFLDGDPDRPIITGRVYHNEAMPPFDLPAEKTRSGLKSQTYKGQGYNEISMDDTAGKEQLRVNAQYNMNSNVNNDQTLDVGNNQSENVGVDRTRTVGSNESITVGANKTVNVGASHSESVASNQSVNVGANQANTVGTNQSNSVGMIKNESVGLMSTESVGVTKSLSAGVSYGVSVGISMSTQVGDSISEKVGGDSSEDIGAKKSVVVGDEISIVCGVSKFNMKKDGTILIEGKDIILKASGKINGKAGGDIVLKAAKIGEN